MLRLEFEKWRAIRYRVDGVGGVLAWMVSPVSSTAQKKKFSIKDFFSICDQIRRKLRIWSHLLKKSLIENFIFCAVWRACVGGVLV